MYVLNNSLQIENCKHLWSPWVFFPSTLSVNLMTQVKPCGSHKTTEFIDELGIFYVPFRICQISHAHTHTHTHTHTQSMHCIHQSGTILQFDSGILFIQLSSFFAFSLSFFQTGSNAVLQICYNQVSSVELPLCSLEGIRSHTDVYLLMIWKMWVFLKGYWSRCLRCSK